MSKSPIKDFSKLIDTHHKTVKKEELRKDEPSYPAQLQRYDVIFHTFRPTMSSTISRANLMQPSGITPDFLMKTPPLEKWQTNSDINFVPRPNS